jgi:hypothetical protein
METITSRFRIWKIMSQFMIFINLFHSIFFGLGDYWLWNFYGRKIHLLLWSSRNWGIELSIGNTFHQKFFKKSIRFLPFTCNNYSTVTKSSLAQHLYLHLFWCHIFESIRVLCEINMIHVRPTCLLDWKDFPKSGRLDRLFRVSLILLKPLLSWSSIRWHLYIFSLVTWLLHLILWIFDHGSAIATRLTQIFIELPTLLSKAWKTLLLFLWLSQLVQYIDFFFCSRSWITNMISSSRVQQPAF